MNHSTSLRLTARVIHLQMCAGLLIFLAMPAHAVGWITVNPLQIDLLAGYYGYQREEPENNIDRYRWEAGFRLEQEGHVMDPRILKFRYYLEPRYLGGEFKSPFTQEDTEDSLLGYFLGMDILKGAILPVDGRLHAFKSSTINTGSLGRRSEYELTEFYGEVTWKYQPFPVVFSARERSNFSISRATVGGASFIRDDVERILKARGESSKMVLLLEQRSLDDKVPSRNNDFELNRFSGRHLLEWGKGSNLVSRAEYWDRTGFNAFKRTEWSQIARIYHTSSVDSQIRYRYRSVTQTVTSKLHSVSYHIRHQLYSNLTTRAGLLYDNRSSPNLDETREQVDLSVAYRKSNLWQMNVGLFLGGNFARIDRDSDRGFQEVVDEPQTVPVNLQFILNSQFVIQSTVIITNDSGTIVYEEGLDYELINLSNGITQVSVTFGGRIEVGQVLLISYRAAILPSVEYDRTSRTGTFSLGWRGFNLTYRNDALNNEVISGAAASLIDTKNETARLTYTKDISRFRINLSAERRLVVLGDNETKVKTASQSFSLRASPRTTINLSLTQSFTENKTQLLFGTRFEEVDFYVGDLSLSWKPRNNLVINPSISAWSREFNRDFGTIESGEDTILSAKFALRWTFRKLYMNLVYYHNNRTITDSMTPSRDVIEDTIRFNLRRRF